MSSPARTLGPLPTTSQVANAKKRGLSDSEDTEDRDVKRIKPQGVLEDSAKKGDSKGEKRKRRRRKRKVSVVKAAESSDAETLASAPRSSIPRILSCPVNSAAAEIDNKLSMVHVKPEDARQPSAGPSMTTAMRSSPPRTTAEKMVDATISHNVDKGKGRATPTPTPEQAAADNERQQVSDLQEQVSSKSTTITQHENLVSTLQQSLSCQICLDLMHRPFALQPCGHSACHQCLVNWFKAPPADVPADEVPPTWVRRKTCPHCRAVVKERPLEIWAIKEMVANLVKSGLAQGFFSPAPAPAETAANADPWAGIFRPARANHNPFDDFPFPVPIQELMGMRDEEDGGVYRCIDCHHEIWDGACSQCGRIYPGHDPERDSHDSDSDDDLSHWGDDGGAFEEDEADIGWRGLAFLHSAVAMFHHPRFDLAREYNDDAFGHISDDPDAETEVISDDDDDGAPRPPRRRSSRRAAQARVVGSPEHAGSGEDLDEDEDGYESSFIDDGEGAVRSPPRSLHPSAPAVDHGLIDLTDEQDDDDDYAGPRGRLFGRGRGPIILDSDEEDEVYHDYEEYRGGYDYHGSADEDEDEEDDGDLAAEVAAREYDLYGDDGSVPRGRGDRYDDYDSDDRYGSEDDDFF